MSLEMNHNVTNLELSGIRRFSNQLAQYPETVNLTVGQPDFPTPASVKEAGMKAIEQNLTTYSHNAGILPLREAVAAFYNEKYDASFDPQSEILVTNGASQAIDSVFRTILNEGDEIIFPAPIYAGYEPVTKAAGAKAVYLDTRDTNFQPDAQKLKALITPKTKAVLFNYPSNPTGATLTKETMDALVEVLKDEDVFIISDEIYGENTYGRPHTSFATYDEIKDKLFFIHGLSKSHSMTGWRIGFLMAPAKYIDQVVKIQGFNAICAALPSQYAALEALTTAKDAPLEMNKSYVMRRDYVYARLIAMGLDVEKPNGAFYIFPKIAKFGLTSMEFATRLMKEGGVGVIPGDAFTAYGEGYIRITYAYATETLRLAMDRLEIFIDQLEEVVTA